MSFQSYKVWLSTTRSIPYILSIYEFIRVPHPHVMVYVLLRIHAQGRTTLIRYYMHLNLYITQVSNNIISNKLNTKTHIKVITYNQYICQTFKTYIQSIHIKQVHRIILWKNHIIHYKITTTMKNISKSTQRFLKYDINLVPKTHLDGIF